jgi:osmotically-inducible protein OsmY
MALCLGALDATNIGVSTLGSTVTLSGEVAAEGDLLIAEGIARRVLGVSSVRNRLVTNRAIVKPSASSVGPIR